MSNDHLQTENKPSIPLLEILMGSLLAVAFWRGSWWLLDSYLFPDNPMFSNLICLLAPIIIVIIWALIVKYKIVWTVDPNSITWN